MNTNVEISRFCWNFVVANIDQCLWGAGGVLSVFGLSGNSAGQYWQDTIIGSQEARLGSGPDSVTNSRCPLMTLFNLVHAPPTPTPLPPHFLLGSLRVLT